MGAAWTARVYGVRHVWSVAQVWQVTDELGLEGGRCESIGRAKLARYTDAVWVPLPAPLTGGCVCAAIGKSSGAVLLDMIDRTGAPPDAGERHALLAKLLRGERVERGIRAHMGADDSRLVRGHRALLAAPRPCHSLRLLPSAVITFLRLILEVRFRPLHLPRACAS